MMLDGVELKALCRPVTFCTHQTEKTFFNGVDFVPVGLVIAETGHGQTQTVDTKLEEPCCLKYHSMLEH